MTRAIEHDAPERVITIPADEEPRFEPRYVVLCADGKNRSLLVLGAKFEDTAKRYAALQDRDCVRITSSRHLRRAAVARVRRLYGSRFVGNILADAISTRCPGGTHTVSLELV